MGSDYRDVLGTRPIEGGHSGPDPKHRHWADSVVTGKNVAERSTAPKEASPSPQRVDWDQIKGIARTYESRGEDESRAYSKHERTESKAEKREERETKGDY